MKSSAYNLNLNIIKILITVIVLAACIVPTLFVFAQTNTYTPLALPQSSAVSFRSDLVGLFLDVFRYTIAASAALAILMIILGGVQYMSTDAWSGKQEGKARIQNALIGLLLVMACFLILQTINPNIVKINFLTKFGTAPTSTLPPRSIPVDSGSGNTVATTIKDYRVTEDGRTYRVTGHKDDNMQTYQLNNLYTFRETTGTFTEHFSTKAACDTQETTQKGRNKVIVESCKPVTYWYAKETDPGFGRPPVPNDPEPAFKSQSACETVKGAGKCVSAVFYDLTVRSVAANYTNFTQKACEYLVSEAKAKNAQSDATCIKQTKPVF